MLTILASGTLVADPVERRSANDKPYVTCAVRVPAEDAEAMMISVIAFSESAVAALLALAKGDALAIAGRAKLSSWIKGGEEKQRLSVVADKVLTVYAGGKQRKAARETEDAAAC
jgi:single-stranded DNA-binding protein